jgi:Spy/CpxP family protein refolding chaperone
MTTLLRCWLPCAVLSLAAFGLVHAQTPSSPARPGPWWKVEPFKRDLGLTADQSARIDRIYEATRPELRQEWEQLSKLEEKLSHLIQKDADEAALSRQIDRVETARANVNKTRQMMLVQMLKILTPEQRVRFKTIHDRWLAEVRRSNEPPRPEE